MKERIEQFGGTFTIDSILDMGTTIIINLQVIEEKYD